MKGISRAFRSFKLREATARLESLKLQLKQTEAEIKKIEAAPIKYETREVAVNYRRELSRSSLKDVLRDARGYSEWLAIKTVDVGPGAASDSGEAKICALLDEMAQRLEDAEIPVPEA